MTDIEGKFAGKVSYLLMLFDRASKELARNWRDADYDLRTLGLPMQPELADIQSDDDADAA